jgi:hypothetical protein
VWSAPESCPDAGQVATTVESLLEQSSSRHDTADLVARGTVTEADGRFELRIQIDSRGASESKTIDADRCGTLADAFAVIVAFAIDPGAGMHPPPPENAPQRQPVRASTDPGGSAVSPIDMRAGPLLATGAGLLPFPAYGVGGTVAVEAGVRLEVSGAYWPERPASVADSASVGEARVRLLSVEPAACVTVGRGPLAFCGGGELGAMEATGTGVSNPGGGTSWWFTLTAGVAWRVAVAWNVDLRLRLDLGIPLYRPSFVFENVGSFGSVQAFRPAPIFAILRFEPEIGFFATDSRGTRHVRR